MAMADKARRTREADELMSIYLQLDPERAARLLAQARDMIAANQAGLLHLRDMGQVAKNRR